MKFLYLLACLAFLLLIAVLRNRLSKRVMEQEDIEPWAEHKFKGHPCSVAGESFSNADGTSRQAIIKKLKYGTPVVFVAEPSNPYDRKAVAIFTPFGQIGYLPSGEETAVRDWLRKGVSFSGCIHSCRKPEDAPYYGVVLDVWRN